MAPLLQSGDGDAAQWRYIATQGPLPHTMDEFWLMVAEQQCSVIVMLTDMSDCPVKCYHYFPTSVGQSIDVRCSFAVQSNIAPWMELWVGCRSFSCLVSMCCREVRLPVSSIAACVRTTLWDHVCTQCGPWHWHALCARIRMNTLCADRACHSHVRKQRRTGAPSHRYREARHERQCGRAGAAVQLRALPDGGLA